MWRSKVKNYIELPEGLKVLQTELKPKPLKETKEFIQ